MIKPRHPWIFGGLLLLSGLLVSMAGFAEGKPVLYASNYILEPVFISTSDSRREVLDWDLLFPLVHHRADRDSSHTRVAPLFRSPENWGSSGSYLYILPFYGSSDGPTETAQFLFPPYGRTDDSSANIHRFTMLGFPPAKGLSKFPTLSLFERVASSEERSHRLFPLYRYRHDLANDETDFDVLLLYRHERDEARTVYDLLPLYGYCSESSGDTQGSAIGPLPFVRSTDWSHHEHATSPTTVPDRFDPVYRYSHDERTGQSIINVLDSESVSLFRARRRISQSFQNPFPPYNYLADYPAGTNSLTETVLIISARVVLGILFHQLRAEQASLPWQTF